MVAQAAKKMEEDSFRNAPFSQEEVMHIISHSLVGFRSTTERVFLEEALRKGTPLCVQIVKGSESFLQEATALLADPSVVGVVPLADLISSANTAVVPVSGMKEEAKHLLMCQRPSSVRKILGAFNPKNSR